MTNEVKNVPELRFPGFEGEWGSSELGNIAENYIGGGTPSTKVKEYWNGNIPWIQSSDLKIDDVKHMEFHKYINSLAIENSSAKLIPKNSIAIVTRVGVGKLALIREEFSTSQDFLSLSNLSLDTNYALYALYKLIRKESTKLQGTSIKGLTKNDLLSKHIKIPSYINEQEQIGDFFSKLDRQIELEEQKLAKLEEQKKGYMQKIFSQELRFKDGNGNNYSEWIKTNLKFLVSYKNGKGYEKEVVQNGKYNIINLNSISTKGMLKDSGKYSDFEDITLKKNDLIMILSDVAKGNLIGKTAIIDQDDKYLLNQRVASLRIKDESTSNVLFIYYFINYFRQYFINMSTGMSQLNINKSTVEDFLIYLPYIEEQDKIGNFFSNLDKSIIKQLDKIELLKERKKGFLQKMFV